MTKYGLAILLPALALSSAAATGQDAKPSKQMSFFVTSKGSGRGGDLGGLAGADRQCQALATAAGAPRRTWRAYLSTEGMGGKPAINARDRIGRGPWYNHKGEMVARDLDDLHGPAPMFQKSTALDERGMVVNGRGDTPNRHDILTGSGTDGRLAPGEGDRTCANWTSSAATGKAIVGHHDRLTRDPGVSPLNSAHPSQGCGLPDLQKSGGDGLFYCFAAK